MEEHICRNDVVMQKVIETVGMYSIKQDMFAYLIGLIIGQEIRFTSARKIRGKLYEQIGYNFKPDQLMNVDLKALGVPEHKIKTITSVAECYTDDMCLNDLKKIQGIGTWTYETLLITYRIDLNLFPLNDVHVNKNLKLLYGVDKKDIAKFVSRWEPYKSVAFWYLWKYGV